MDAAAFVKMHGLGNDFVVLDARARPLALSEPAIRAIGDRRTGVGFDQLIVIEPPTAPGADAFMRFYNPDGSEAGACGNGSRCIASILMKERGRDAVAIQTVAGLLEAARIGTAADGTPIVGVDMGAPRFGWQDIPLARDCDTLHLPLALGPVADPVGTDMGNPHATFFVADAAAIPVEQIGPILERDPLFPERANIGFAQVLGPDRIRLRVWERGAGLTRACGSGACAALVAASRRGLVGRRAELVLDGGTLGIEWRADGHVVMTGGVAVAFSGTLDKSLLAR